MKEERSEAPSQDRGAPPGFMDRPEVKEAVGWALAQIGKKSTKRGMTSEDLARLADDEQRRLETES